MWSNGARPGEAELTAPGLGRPVAAVVLDTEAAVGSLDFPPLLTFKSARRAPETPCRGRWWWPWSRSSPRWSGTAARTRRSRCPPTTTCARDLSAWRIRCTASKGPSLNRAGTVEYHLCLQPVCTENRPILSKRQLYDVMKVTWGVFFYVSPIKVGREAVSRKCVQTGLDWCFNKRIYPRLIIDKLFYLSQLSSHREKEPPN